MAPHDFSSARSLLPRVLARLARETGKGSALRPVWNEVVGAVAARNTTPLFLEGKTLIVQAESPGWAAALGPKEADICARLAERLGEGAVARIVYRAKNDR